MPVWPTAFCQVQAQLQKRNAGYEINLTVLPGITLDGLTEHLNACKGYHHVVHLDMHGLVEDGIAYLKFAKDLYQSELNQTAAENVSKLLSGSGVRGAVINACDCLSDAQTLMEKNI